MQSAYDVRVPLLLGDQSFHISQGLLLDRSANATRRGSAGEGSEGVAQEASRAGGVLLAVESGSQSARAWALGSA
jgi:hypothetical protein